jgi:hypothetical protein
MELSPLMTEILQSAESLTFRNGTSMPHAAPRRDRFAYKAGKKTIEKI